MIPYEFQQCLFTWEKAIGALIGFAMNLCIALGKVVTLTMLTLPVNEKGLAFHFFVLYLNFFPLKHSLINAFSAAINMVVRF